MKRLAILNGLRSHPFYGKDLKRLSASEIASVRTFCLQHERLDFLAFEQAVQRWMLDGVRPKHYPLMCDLLLATNVELERLSRVAR